MELYALRNKDGKYLAKKPSASNFNKGGNLYMTENETDRVITYRTLKQIQNFYEDKEYFSLRGINIKDFIICKVELILLFNN